ncbi:hypothetical protein E1B28_001529 [Marasmius oreades]|uniref:Thioredoxin domain-containing protein n=1 Tax=Marasmius oreades TaxID=181124 RepID=A0A9P7V3K7_9AGAR|nr:uncharacterized protein E1B28_001529 [Marasmius oreades]KAG7099711.1 hypothetical protein E1B28_001529 [Marasmius oreades]
MPLNTTDSTGAELAKQVPSDGYLIFYSSVVDGQLWCQDCRAVETLVEDSFSSADAPSALIVYVGDRATWRGKPSHPLRSEPWKVTGVPTIVKLKDGKEEGRLVEWEVVPNLKELLGAQ